MPKNNNINIPACYENQVTSRQACPYIAPKSGRHIEDLPGLGMQAAAQIAEEKTVSGTDLIWDKNILAIQLLETQIQQRLSYWGYMLPTMQFTREFCSFSTSNTNAPAALERGLRITQNNTSSPYSCVYIETIYVKTKTAINTDIFIKDKIGNILNTINVTIPANVLTPIAANLCIYENEVFVVMDDTLIETYKADCFNGSCCGADRASKFFSISGWNGQNCGREGYGLSVKAGIKCNISALMCDVLPLIPNALLYQTGIEIVEELMASSRLSIVTLSEQDWAEGVKQSWEQKVSDELDVITPTFLEQLKIKDTHCVTCKKGTIRVRSNV